MVLFCKIIEIEHSALILWVAILDDRQIYLWGWGIVWEEAKKIEGLS